VVIFTTYKCVIISYHCGALIKPYIHFGLIRELDISDSCCNCRQQHVTEVHFHIPLGEYRGTTMMVLWVFTPCWMISFFRCFQGNRLPPSSVWLNLVQVDVQASKILEQTYQPTLPKKSEHSHSSNTYHQNLKTCKEV
jgi:hypothetical protein